jgi:hypothetical protein
MVLPTILTFALQVPDHGAALSLFNLSCVPACRPVLLEHNVHIKLLDLLLSVCDIRLKSIYLQMLVQISSSSVVTQLLQHGLIAKLDSQVTNKSESPSRPPSLRKALPSFSSTGENVDSTPPSIIRVANDILPLLLRVVAFELQELSEQDMTSIVRMLLAMCTLELEESDSADDGDTETVATSDSTKEPHRPDQLSQETLRQLPGIVCNSARVLKYISALTHFGYRTTPILRMWQKTLTRLGTGTAPCPPPIT